MKKAIYFSLLMVFSLTVFAQEAAVKKTTKKADTEATKAKKKIEESKTAVKKEVKDGTKVVKEKPAKAVADAKAEAKKSKEDTKAVKEKATKAVSDTKSEAKKVSTSETKKATAVKEQVKNAKVTGEDKVTGTYNGKKVYTGPRGGRYYINDNGNKTYIK